MAQIKKDTSLRKAILQAAITGQLISDIGGESDVLFSNEKKSKTKLDSEADLPLASRVSKRNSVVSDSERTTPSPRGYAPKTPNEFASFENQNSVSERSERPTLPETGKQLLDRIIEERNKKLLAEWEEALKKNSKAKKPAPIVASEIDEEEIPFEIPENWCWCRLEDLVTILGDGLHGTPQYDISGEYYFVNGNNLNNGLIEIKPDTKKVNKKEYDKYKKELNETTIFVSINGTIGNIAFYNYEKIILGKSACYFNVAIKDLKKYFFYLFQADYFLTYALDNATGTTIKNVGLGTMRSFLLPLPPLAVQNAIVETLEQVLPLVDAYENALLQKEELKSALPDKIKKAILQEAITGKLTEQWRKQKAVVEPVETTESGKQLLDQIIEERNAKALAEWEEALKKNPKAKKPADIVASEIEEEDIPFEVPESWCWCKLGDICTKLVDGDHNPPAGVPTKTEFIMASSQNINDDSLVELEKVRYLSKEVFEVENERTKAEKGDIFFTSVGTLGRSCIFDGSRNICFQRSVSVIKTEIYNKFLKYCLDAPFIQYFIIDNATGTAQKGFYLNQLAKLVIPLPPLEEQEEIVKKLEELLPLCK